MISKILRSATIYFLLAALVLAGAGCGDDSPSGVVEEFVNASIENDCDKIIDLLYFGEAVDDEMKDELTDSCEETGLSPEGSELVSVETSNETIDGDKATVTTKTVMKLGGEEMTEEQDIQLIKVDGEWKIDLSTTIMNSVEP